MFELKEGSPVTHLVDGRDVLKFQLVHPNRAPIATHDKLVVTRPPSHRPYPFLRFTHGDQSYPILYGQKPRTAVVFEALRSNRATRFGLLPNTPNKTAHFPALRDRGSTLDQSSHERGNRDGGRFRHFNNISSSVATTRGVSLRQNANNGSHALVQRVASRLLPPMAM